MVGHPRLLGLLSGFLLWLALPAVAGAAEIVDRGVASPALQVDSHGVALVTYTVHGSPRHVLYWGAIDWSPRFSRDYSGGWKSRVADYRRFGNSCKAYTGPPLSLMVAACDAPDGSHWALQEWRRLWQNYGGASAPAELYISHWRDDVGTLEIQTDYSYRGRFQHLWGRFLYHGSAVFGTHHTLQGVPTDRQGRNIYVDYLTGTVWRRVNSFLTHPPTAGFCYTFASHPAASPAWNGVGTGDAYRATAIGPGVSPLVQTHFAPPGRYTRATDAAANAQQQALLGGDPRCRID
jgi:hypothetical protein